MGARGIDRRAAVAATSGVAAAAPSGTSVPSVSAAVVVAEAFRKSRRAESMVMREEWVGRAPQESPSRRRRASGNVAPAPSPRRPMRHSFAPSRPLLVLITSAALAMAPLASAGAQRSFANSLTIGTVDSVYSKAIKEQRPYLVYLPAVVQGHDVHAARYPVLYLLDGDAHFHSVTGLLQILGHGGQRDLRRPRDDRRRHSQHQPDARPVTDAGHRRLRRQA